MLGYFSDLNCNRLISGMKFLGKIFAIGQCGSGGQASGRVKSAPSANGWMLPRRFRLPRPGFPASPFRFSASPYENSASPFHFPMSHFHFPALGFRFPTPSFRFPALGFHFPTPSFQKGKRLWPKGSSPCRLGINDLRKKPPF